MADASTGHYTEIAKDDRRVANAVSFKFSGIDSVEPGTSHRRGTARVSTTLRRANDAYHTAQVSSCTSLLASKRAQSLCQCRRSQKSTAHASAEHSCDDPVSLPRTARFSSHRFCPGTTIPRSQHRVSPRALAPVFPSRDPTPHPRAGPRIA